MKNLCAILYVVTARKSQFTGRAAQELLLQRIVALKGPARRRSYVKGHSRLRLQVHYPIVDEVTERKLCPSVVTTPRNTISAVDATQLKRRALRARALAASASRLLGGDLVSRDVTSS